MGTPNDGSSDRGNNNMKDPIKQLDAISLKAQTKTVGDDTPIEIDNESQLFADDYLIEGTASLFRRLNQPKKERTPFLVSEKPWEGNGIVYGSMIEEEDHLRLYYKSCPMKNMPNVEHKKKYGYGKFAISMARSADGRSFEKPELENALQPNTNLILDDPIDDFTILKDHDAESEAERYKMLSSKGNWWGGLSSAVSPDGISWTWTKEYAVPYFGDRCSYWYDPKRKKHIAWSRNYQIEGGRVIYHKETSDFSQWDYSTTPENMQGFTYKGELPFRSLAPDRHDNEMVQFYGGYGFWYRSIYFAYIEVYHMQWQRIDTQLACSRDGVHWERLCDREVFIENGGHGDFDAYWAVPTFNRPILKDGELLIHYNGRSEPHTQPGFAHVAPGMSGAFALSTLREDGFVSLDATGNTGVLETKVLKLPEKRRVLAVNISPFCERKGYDPMKMKLEILSNEYETLAEFSVVTHGDNGEIWREFNIERELPENVRLRFSISNARLYSFRFSG